jgi:hypothetical protein
MATSALERIRALKRGNEETVDLTEEVEETPAPQPKAPPKALPSVGKEKNLAVAEKVLGYDTDLLKQTEEQEAQLDQLIKDRDVAPIKYTPPSPPETYEDTRDAGVRLTSEVMRERAAPAYPFRTPPSSGVDFEGKVDPSFGVDGPLVGAAKLNIPTTATGRQDAIDSTQRQIAQLTARLQALYAAQGE